MDPQETAKAVQEGSKAFGKFTDLVRDFFSPSKTRRQAKAEAFAICTVSQAIRENSDMDIVLEDGKLNIKKDTPDALVYRAEQRSLVENCRREENLEEILKITAGEVQNFEDVSDEPVEKDWLARFFSIAQDISNEDMQEIWGKILADEIKKPGSFSLRTLEKVRNLTRDDAQRFQDMAAFMINGGGDVFIPNYPDLLEKYSVSYSDLLQLDDCGLINSSSLIKIAISISSSSSIKCFTKSRAIDAVVADGQDKKLSIGIFPLSVAGAELFRIVDCVSNNDYFLEFAEWVHKEHAKIKPVVSVYKLEFIKDGTINHIKEPLVIFGE